MAMNIMIVGGGIVGCMTALELNKRGHAVTIIERNTIAAQTSGEASWAGAGILLPLLPWMYKDEVNALSLAGAARYPHICAELLAETGINPEYTQSGMLVKAPFDGSLAQSWCEKNGVEFQQKDQDLFLPAVAQVKPPHLLQALKACLLKRGVKLMEQTQLEPLPACENITSWRTNAGKALSADAYVVTSGAWSFELLKNTASQLNIKPMRGQILLYQLPPNMLQHIIYQDGFYLLQRRDGYLLAGSTLEDVGFDTSTTEAVKLQLQARAEAILPSLRTAPIIKHWSGLRPGTPDNVPTIARHPAIKNLYLNTGHFRYGLTMAPESARRLAELIV